MSERYLGTVKWFNSTKGFGFIGRDDDAGDVFVHHSSIVSQDRYKNLDEGDRVEFSIEEADKGPRAVGVTRI